MKYKKDNGNNFNNNNYNSTNTSKRPRTHDILGRTPQKRTPLSEQDANMTNTRAIYRLQQQMEAQQNAGSTRRRELQRPKYNSPQPRQYNAPQPRRRQHHNEKSPPRRRQHHYESTEDSLYTPSATPTASKIRELKLAHKIDIGAVNFRANDALRSAFARSDENTIRMFQLGVFPPPSM